MSIQRRFVSAWYLPVLAFALLIALLDGNQSSAIGPCCLMKQPTFRAEMVTADVVVLAKLQFTVPPDLKTGIDHAQFEIVDVLKGEKRGLVGGQMVVPHYGGGKPGDIFLLTKAGPPTPEWSMPDFVTPRTQDYLRKLAELPDDPTKRFLFYHSHFEDQDAMIARDAAEEYDETPYAELKTFQPHLNREQLLAWLGNPEIRVSHKRLYYKLLGLCGKAQDAAGLEVLIKSADKKSRPALDQLLACYITMKGELGLALVEDLYLKNKQADYADTYSAIVACRFHLHEVKVLPRDRLISALKQMLQRPELADLVIPDLARFEDWSIADQLFEMFKTADTKTSWVRIPVINYLRKCPLPRAKEMLAECKRLDVKAFERAETFFPE